MQWNMTWLWAWRFAPSLWNSVWVTFVFMRLKGAVTKTWQGEDLLCQLFLLPETWGEAAFCRLLPLDGAEGYLWSVSDHLSHGVFSWTETPDFPLLVSESLGVNSYSMKVYVVVGYISMYFHLLLGFLSSKNTICMHGYKGYRMLCNQRECLQSMLWCRLCPGWCFWEVCWHCSLLRSRQG